MKNVISIFIFAILLSCCSKDNKVLGNSGSSQLPPETQTGANTVGCLVNGKVYLPSQRGINTDVNCFYQFVDNEYFFTMAFADNANFGPDVSVQTGKTTLIQGNTYVLNKNYPTDGDYTGGGGSFRLSSTNKFYTTSIKTGELKITKLDPANSIISGTFWFDAVNSAGEKVEIRQGRFDWKY
jgi:hypothetical protein